jgi:DNA-binding PadR family transcriptional regulator
MEVPTVRRLPDPKDLLPLTPVVLHILLALADGRPPSETDESAGRHGYAVAQEVEAMTDGQIRMGPGTLYGSIQRMLRSELIEEVARPRGTTRSATAGADDDERRRYYRLSVLGRKVLRLELARLARVVVVARAKHLLTGPEPA